MRLTILYGTQTGNAERVAFRVARLALQRGVSRVRCLPADELPLEEWVPPATDGDAPETTAHCTLLICSNANQGDAPLTIRETWARLLRADAPRMVGMRYAVFGLGDSLYAKFNFMAKMLHNRLRQLGAAPVLLRGLGDESDAKGVDETLLPWLMELWAALGLLSLTGQRTQEDPLGGQLFPLYTITRVDASAAGCASGTEAAAELYCPAVPHYTERTFVCEVTRNVRLTSSDHFQAVHHIELCREGGQIINYQVGDALAVHCRNRPEQVAELLARLHLDGDDVVCVTPDHSHGIVSQPQRPFLHRPMTIHHLLSCYVDLDAVVSQEFFWMLARLAEAQPISASLAAGCNEAEVAEEKQELVERLLEFASPINVDEFLRYSHREKRNVCEVLHDFGSISVSLELLLSFTAVMQPRYFSFSSAPAMDAPTRVHVTVAQLEWDTPMARHRTGLCSTFLINAAVGTRVVCNVWEGNLTLPPQPSPLLCIATGTGLAPVRSLLRQCAGLSATAGGAGWRTTPVYLFFGCRNKAKDFYYAEEWDALRQDGLLGKLTVVPAFSRDTATKVYVQHQLGQHAKAVGSLLREESNVTVYVCGNAKQMPKDVQSVLMEVARTVACDGSEEVTAALLKQLTREGRYQVDTWSA